MQRTKKLVSVFLSIALALTMLYSVPFAYAAEQDFDPANSYSTFNDDNTELDNTNIASSDNPDTTPSEDSSKTPTTELSTDQSNNLTADTSSNSTTDLSSEDSPSSLETQASLQTLTPGRYYIRPAVSNIRVLDIAGGSVANSANLQIYQSNKTPAQIFDVSFDEPTGYYTIRNVKSGLVIDVQSGKGVSGTNVQQYQDNGSAAQKWVLTASKDFRGQDVYTIASALDANNKLVLDVAYANDDDRANIQIYNSNNTPAQQFYFVDINPSVSSAKTVDDGIYTISSTLSTNPTMSLDIPAASDDAKLQIQLYQSNNTPAQGFEIKWIAADNAYLIRSMASALALDVSGGGIVATTPAIQYPSNNTIAQRWAIQQNPDGTYSFIAINNGLALDVVGGKNTNGTKLHLYYPNGTAAQKFTLAQANQPALSGIVSVVSVTDTAKRVDIVGGSRVSGGGVQLYKSNGTFAQKFEVVSISVSPDIYAFKSLNSGLYITAADNGDVRQIGIAGEDPTNAQKWTLNWTLGGYTLTNVGDPAKALAVNGSGVAISTAAAEPPTAITNTKLIFRFTQVPILDDGHYIIKATTGLAVDMAGAETHTGNIVQLWADNNTAAQKWLSENRSNGYVSFINPLANKAIDVVNGSTGTGATIQIYPFNDTAAQHWKPVPTGGGYFYLQSEKGTYLTAAGDGNRNGEKLITGSINSPSLLKFTFIPTVYVPPAPYNGNFIDVNISTQRMMLVRDGWPILESDVVTGAPGLNTPTGIYHILYKQSPAYLMGNAYVVYWMPFTYQGHGFHDASWQNGVFGGSRYVQGYGSHGCVNMPFAAAQTLYMNIWDGFEVRIHY
ncbi:hypothetical protein FACS1894104_3050 [Actinomycetota bacterium]|nr:hypothetical protein FACS1894104_3050 [Actinomycetota bacterium]